MCPQKSYTRTNMGIQETIVYTAGSWKNLFTGANIAQDNELYCNASLNQVIVNDGQKSCCANVHELFEAYQAQYGNVPQTPVTTQTQEMVRQEVTVQADTRHLQLKEKELDLKKRATEIERLRLETLAKQKSLHEKEHALIKKAKELNAPVPVAIPVAIPVTVFVHDRTINSESGLQTNSEAPKQLRNLTQQELEIEFNKYQLGKREELIKRIETNFQTSQYCTSYDCDDNAHELCLRASVLKVLGESSNCRGLTVSWPKHEGAEEVSLDGHALNVLRFPAGHELFTSHVFGNDPGYSKGKFLYCIVNPSAGRFEYLFRQSDSSNALPHPQDSNLNRRACWTGNSEEAQFTPPDRVICSLYPAACVRDKAGNLTVMNFANDFEEFAEKLAASRGSTNHSKVPAIYIAPKGAHIEPRDFWWSNKYKNDGAMLRSCEILNQEKMALDKVAVELAKSRPPPCGGSRVCDVPSLESSRVCLEETLDSGKPVLMCRLQSCRSSEALGVKVWKNESWDTLSIPDCELISKNADLACPKEESVNKQAWKRENNFRYCRESWASLKAKGSTLPPGSTFVTPYRCLLDSSRVLKVDWVKDPYHSAQPKSPGGLNSNAMPLLDENSWRLKINSEHGSQLQPKKVE